MKPLQSFYRKWNSTGQFDGADVKGIPKVRYVKKLVSMDKKDLEWATQLAIKKYLLKKRDGHWQLNACYFEHLNRGTQTTFHKLYAKLKYQIRK